MVYFNQIKKSILVFLFLVFTKVSYSQQDTDTTFSIREFTCTCRQTNSERNAIFDRTEVSATYPGGQDEWEKFVAINLKKGVGGKKKKFVMMFVIDKNGNLKDFRPLDTINEEKYTEAVRLLKESGKWFPAMQNRYCVNSYYRLTFKL